MVNSADSAMQRGAECLEQYQATHDQDAARELVSSCSDKIDKALYFTGVPSSEIADVRQEVFTKIFINADSYKPERGFSAWVNRIAVNAGRDFHRRKKHDITRLVQHMEDDPRGQLDDPVDPSTIFDTQFDAGLEAMEILRALPTEIKKAVEEAVLFDRPAAQLARSSDSSSWMINSSKNKGIAMIRDGVLEAREKFFGSTDVKKENAKRSGPSFEKKETRESIDEWVETMRSGLEDGNVLSNVEREVFRQYLDGVTYNVIAENLHITKPEAYKHVINAKKKLERATRNPQSELHPSDQPRAEPLEHQNS